MFTKKSYGGGGGARGGSRGGSRFGGGSKPWERGGDRTPEMHSATCDDCGQRCEVPFKPNGKKPIFCRACFGKSEGGSGDRFDAPRAARPAVNGDPYRDQLKEINSKLDAIIRALNV